MRIKELLSVTHNKNNKQDTFSVKKKKLKEIGLSIDDILDIKLEEVCKKWLE